MKKRGVICPYRQRSLTKYKGHLAAIKQVNYWFYFSLPGRRQALARGRNSRLRLPCLGPRTKPPPPHSPPTPSLARTTAGSVRLVGPANDEQSNLRNRGYLQ